MRFFWRLLRPRTRTRTRPRSRCRVELTILEDRRLLTIGEITAAANPNILLPPNGRLVPVTISGEVGQLLLNQLPGHPTAKPANYDALVASLESQPGPGTVLGQVTDEYRLLEPRVRATLRLVGNNPFFNPASSANAGTAVVGVNRTLRYSFTVYLQAARSTNVKDGRAYNVAVGVEDPGGGSGKTITVLVPKDHAELLPHPAHHLKTRTKTKK